MWWSYLTLCFYHLVKGFISNWKCSTKEAAPWKTNTCYMVSNMAEPFWVWCHLNSISMLMMLNSHITVLWCFCRISVISEFSCLDIRLKLKIRKYEKSLFSRLQRSNACGSVFLIIISTQLFKCSNWHERNRLNFINQVSVFEYRVQNENPEIKENVYFFGFIKFKWMWAFFLITILTSLVLKLK